MSYSALQSMCGGSGTIQDDTRDLRGACKYRWNICCMQTNLSSIIFHTVISERTVAGRDWIQS